MSFFEVNHNEAFEGSGLLPEGEYEVIVAKAFEDETQNGIKHINIHLAIRNDIDQRYKNKRIFASVWRAKATGEYNKGILNTIARAIQIPNGKKYTGLDQLLADFVGKTARVKVKHEEYNGKTNERVNAWEQTKFTTCNHVFNEVNNGFGSNQTQDEEDVPF